MPKQKDGKNWAVDFTVENASGEVQSATRKFRVRQGAQDFVQELRNIEQQEQLIVERQARGEVVRNGAGEVVEPTGLKISGVKIRKLG